MQVRQ